MELHTEERKSRRLRKRKTYRDRKLVFLFFAMFLAFFIDLINGNLLISPRKCL